MFQVAHTLILVLQRSTARTVSIPSTVRLPGVYDQFINSKIDTRNGARTRRAMDSAILSINADSPTLTKSVLEGLDYWKRFSRTEAAKGSHRNAIPSRRALGAIVNRRWTHIDQF